MIDKENLKSTQGGGGGGGCNTLIPTPGSVSEPQWSRTTGNDTSLKVVEESLNEVNGIPLPSQFLQNTMASFSRLEIKALVLYLVGP